MVVKDVSSLEGQALSKDKVSVGLPALPRAAWVPRAGGRRRRLGPRALRSQRGSGVRLFFRFGQLPSAFL